MDEQQFSEMIKAINSLGYGDSATSGPGAIEGIALAMAGEHLRHPVGEAINRVADALERIADALEAHGE